MIKKSLFLRILSIAFLTLFAVQVKAQCKFGQLGADIDGEAASDQSGYSVSLSSDGNTVAIGAYNNDGSASNAGHVRVYKRISGTWTQQGADIDGEAANNQSGMSVSLSSDGSSVAIGAPFNNGNGSSAGHVRVYKFISGTWTKQGADIDGEAANDRSGFSVSLSSDGSSVAIGAYANDGNVTDAGHVRVYKFISGTWTQQGADIDGEATADFSGNSVSLSSDGSTVAIGAISNDGTASNAGHVRVYKLISGTWTQQGADIDGEAANDNSGYSVSLSSDGNTVAIGANLNDGSAANAGHVRVYKLISGTWTQQGADIDGEAANDRSGFSVSLSSDGIMVAIGAYLNDGSGSNAGHVRVYKLISGTWTKQGADIDGEAAGDLSGVSVSLSSDGRTVAIGADGNDGTGTSAGHVRVYEWKCPEIKLTGNSIEIASGDILPSVLDHTNFGFVSSGATRSYKLYNTGTDTLKITSSSISGTNASNFSISGMPSYVLAGDSATFTITFTASTTGTRVATITINNNDEDEGTYTYGIRASLDCTGKLWSQLGADIDGEAASDYSGYSASLSSDGSTVAIGAISNDGTASNAGHVRVYKRISGTWTQQGADIDGEATGDFSGNSVSLSSDGSTVAIGAPNNDGTASNAGHVRVYKLISGTWTQQGADIDGEAAGDQSGNSVSLSSDGSTVAIGARGNDGAGADAGHVRVYKLISGTWTQQGADIDGEAANNLSGISVSLSSDGSSVAIGAHFNDGSAIDAGHVRVYKFISGTWTQQGADIDGEALNDRSGFSVSLSSDGSTVAIGAHFNDGAGADAGHVRVYKLISGTWTKQGADIDGEAAGDLSGYSVSLSSDGNTVAIGARGNDGNGVSAGHVRVYKLISGTWTQQGADIDGEAANDNSGWSVSLSSDGSTVAIGAIFNDGNGTDAGHVRVYELGCCDFTAPLANTVGTHIASGVAKNSTYNCYCNAAGEILLALDTTGSGAVIKKDSVSLQIGNPNTISYSNAGGIITNTSGGVIFNRKWNVQATTQPTSNVKVRYFFTDVEYDSIVSKLDAVSTTITSPNQLQMYKLIGNGFQDPHATGVNGIFLNNGSTADNFTWVYSAYGTDHSAEFTVNSFSGGGAGFGAANLPLPVDLLQFSATKMGKKDALLTWQTATETATDYFEIERSYDGQVFTKIGQVGTTDNTKPAKNYEYFDNTIAAQQNQVFYRLNMVETDGSNAQSPVQIVYFENILSVYPNPTDGLLHIDGKPIKENITVKLIDISGKVVLASQLTETNNTINMQEMANGVYTVAIISNKETRYFKIIKQ